MGYSFNPDHAVSYGVDEAIVIDTMVFWISKNKTEGRNFNEGRTWTFNSVEAWTAHFPFWSPRQMKRVIDSLVEQGIIVTGRFNKVSFDRTLWYAFSDESKFLPSVFHSTKWENGTDETVQTIPATNPSTNPVREEPQTPAGESPELFPTPTKESKKTTKESKAEESIAYLNQKTGSKFRTYRGTGLMSLIEQGTSLDTIKAVIDLKVEEWKDNADMARYLTPSTLFRASNFEKYENALRLPKPTSQSKTVKEEPDDSWRFHDPLAGQLL